MSAPNAQSPKGASSPAASGGDPDRPPPSNSRVFIAQRSQPLPEEERKRGDVAKAVAGELGFRIRSYIRDQIEDFRASDRFFKIKFFIVLSWVVISSLSIVVATGSRVSTKVSNELGARLKLSQTSLGWAIQIENTTNNGWSQCNLVLNNRFVAQKPFIQPQERVVVGPSNFIDIKKGVPMAASVTPDSLRISCEEGETTPELGR